MSKAQAAGSAIAVLPDGSWQRILDRLRASFSSRDQERGLRTWLCPSKVRPVHVEEGRLLLECPTPLFQMMIRDRFAAGLAEAAGQETGWPVSEVVCRVTRNALREHRERLGEPGTAPIVREADRRPRTSFGQGFKILDDFVVGSCNRLAYDAVRRILELPGDPVNPLFIHGSSGLGKTHLEQGLAVAFKERFPHSKIIYLGCEQFRNAYLSACEKGTVGLQAFRVRLRHADLLLVDDIHFLSRGQMEKTKDELFATFNELAGRGKKVVITSDAHPTDIRYLEDRFIQRFTGGLVVALDRPDLPVRREVALSKARSQGVSLPAEVGDFIADHITDNIRELEGAVNKVVAYARSFHRTIDLQLARQALSELIARDAGEPRLKVILRAVADHFELSAEDILGKGRSGQRSIARHIAMYVLKSSSADTYESVGQAFGVASHSSVAYACEQVARYRAKDPELDRFIEELLLRLRRR